MRPWRHKPPLPRSLCASLALPRGPHPARAALAAESRFGACSTRRGHTPDSPPAHTCPLTRTARKSTRPCDRMGTWAQITLVRDQSPKQMTSTHPRPLLPAGSPFNAAHPYSPRGYSLYGRPFPGHPNAHPHPVHTGEHTQGVPREPTGQTESAVTGVGVAPGRRTPGVPRLSALTSTPLPQLERKRRPDASFLPLQ